MLHVSSLKSNAGTAHMGAEVSGVDWARCSSAEMEQLGRIIADHLVVVVRRANVSRERFWEMCWHIGQLRGTEPGFKPEVMPSALEDIGDDHIENGFYIRQGRNYMPGLGRVTGERAADGKRTGIFADGPLLWHSNQAGAENPSPLVATQGWAGVEGSVTEVLETVTLWNELSDEWKERLRPVRCVHVFRDGCIAPLMQEDENQLVRSNVIPVAGVTTPLVKHAPAGQEGLAFHLNTVERFADMSEAESNEIRAYLLDRMFDPRFIYAHEWATGDLFFFDNILCLHRRPTWNTQKRILHRIALGFNKLLPNQPDY
jgi:alpha-ketoglutarate-dependent taurine dioxygenase